MESGGAEGVGAVEGFDDSGGFGSAGKGMEVVGGGVGEEVVKDGGSIFFFFFFFREGSKLQK